MAELWRVDGDNAWPELTFAELRAAVSKAQGYHVTPSTVRSSIYEHSDIFERAQPEGALLLWRLTKAARKGKVGGDREHE